MRSSIVGLELESFAAAFAWMRGARELAEWLVRCLYTHYRKNTKNRLRHHVDAGMNALHTAISALIAEDPWIVGGAA